MTLYSCALLLLLSSTTPPAPTHLRTGHRAVGAVPLLDGVNTPRFSWRVHAESIESKHVVQTAYEVTVVEILPSPSVVWSSGKIPSNASILVPYGGESTPFHAHATFNWTVRIWTNEGGPSTMSPTSDAATFTTGFVGNPWGDTELDHGWLALPNDKSHQVRTMFTLPANKTAISARVYIAAPGYAAVWINGVELGQSHALGPWTTWSKRVLYQSYEIAPSALLMNQTAGNVIGVWLGNGQFRSKWSHAACKGGPPPITFSLTIHVSFDDGSSAFFGGTRQAGTWRAAAGPILSNDVYNGTHYDARAETPGWLTSHYDASSWKMLLPYGNTPCPLGPVTVDAFVPIQIVRRTAPLNVTRQADGSFLFFFPENLAGVVELNLARGEVPSGTSLTMAHSEQLKDSSGNLCLVACDGKGVEVFYPFATQSGSATSAIDIYTRNGTAPVVGWRPRFTYHGFQFVNLTGWPAGMAPPTTATLTQLAVHSDNARIGKLTVAPTSKVLQAIEGNIVRTLLNNMHSVESDCPTRERVGWTGDGQATAETAFRTLDVASFYEKWMQDMEDAMGGDGAISSTVPFAKHVPPVDPTWTSIYPQLARLMYLYTGDTLIVERHYANLKLYVAYVANVTHCSNCKPDTADTTRAPNGLPWFYMNGDWMENRPEAEELLLSGKPLSSFHYILDVEIVAELAGVLGKTAEAAQFSAFAATLRDKYNAVYLSNTTAPPPPAPGAVSFCDEQRETKKGGRALDINCGAESHITEIRFVSFGTPIGSCETHSVVPFKVNPQCDAPRARGVVEAKCLGAHTCSIAPTDEMFGPDPCVGTIKSLAVVVNCSGGVAPTASTLTKWSYGESQTINAVPYVAGFTPVEHHADVEQSLVALIAAANTSLTTGFVGNKYVFPALLKAKETQLLMDLALKTTEPSLGRQVAVGATTLFENWSGRADDGRAADGAPSHDHHFMGGFGQFYWEALVGIQQGTRTAFEAMVIAPAVTDDPRLSWISATTVTPRGVVAVSWRQSPESGGTFSLNVTVPPNSRAAVHVPKRARGEVRIGGVVVKVGEVTDDAVVVRVGSGEHVFISV